MFSITKRLHKINSIFDKEVCQYDLNGDIIGVFGSIKKASLSTGVHKSGILNCCRKRQKTSGGFKWNFVSYNRTYFDKTNFIKIKGYDNYYINPNGDVFNYSIKKFIKPKLNNENIYTVRLMWLNEPIQLPIHYLVATTFIYRDFDKGQRNIKHLDGNKLNNHMNNLCWY